MLYGTEVSDNRLAARSRVNVVGMRLMDTVRNAEVRRRLETERLWTKRGETEMDQLRLVQKVMKFTVSGELLHVIPTFHKHYVDFNACGMTGTLWSCTTVCTGYN